MAPVPVVTQIGGAIPTAPIDMITHASLVT